LFLRTRKIILKKETFSQGEMTEFKNPPPAGHYSFAYTPTFAGSTWTTSFAFNTNSSSTHTFIIDNISMCAANAVQPITSYSADVLMHTDYYGFGMQQPGRTWVGSDYRYGMNTQERNDEIFKGAYGALYWEYDARIGRRWNLDPIVKDAESPYVCLSNNPILLADPLGDDVGVGKKKEKIPESDKKKVKVTPKNVIDADKQTGDAKGDVAIFDMKDMKVEKIYNVDGDNVDKKDYDKALKFNDKIDAENAGIDKHNALIDKKIAFIEDVGGFTTKYDKETGKISGPVVKEDKKLAPFQQTLFDAVNSPETYVFNVGGNKVFSFDKKSSFTMSLAALNRGDRDQLGRIVAGDAAVFLGKTADVNLSTLSYLKMPGPGKHKLIFDDKKLTIETKFVKRTTGNYVIILK